jgi:hypothetical protein
MIGNLDEVYHHCNIPYLFYLAIHYQIPDRSMTFLLSVLKYLPTTLALLTYHYIPSSFDRKCDLACCIINTTKVTVRPVLELSAKKLGIRTLQGKEMDDILCYVESFFCVQVNSCHSSVILTKVAGAAI